MKVYFLLLISFLLCFHLSAQVNQYGIPFITNYSPQEYMGSEQNWAVVQDQRGVMYFGNNDDGILEFDGEKWRKIPITNKSIIRSLAIDSAGRIFVGGVSDFGILKPDKSGILYYHSLKKLINDSVCDFADVWKTYTVNHKVYFCSNEKIFEYNYSDVKVYTQPDNVVFTFNIDSNLYAADYSKGLRHFNDHFNLVKGGDFYSKKGIYTIEKLNNKLLIGTNPGGLHLLDLETGISITPFEKSPINAFLSKNVVYHSNSYSGNQIAFATIMNGAVVIDQNGQMTTHLNKSNGLQDETVIYLYSDQLKNMWFGLNVGISRAELNSPFAMFNDRNGLNGGVLDICEFQNRLFVATVLGVFYLDFDKDGKPTFKQVEMIKDQTWSIIPIKNKGVESLIVGSIMGLYEIDQTFRVRYIDNDVRSAITKDGTNYVQELYKPGPDSELVYVGLINGLFSMKKNKGVWNRVKEYSLDGAGAKSIAIDNAGDLWVGTNYNGFYCFKQAESLNRLQYTTKEGLPSDKDNFVSEWKNQKIFYSTKGFLEFDATQKKFVKNHDLSGLKQLNNFNIFHISQNRDNEIWVSSGNSNRKFVEKISISENGLIEDTTVFKRLPNVQFDIIYKDSKGITWMGSSLGLFSYNEAVQNNNLGKFNVLIRRVNTVKDSLLFYGTNFEIDNQGDTIVSLAQPDALKPTLKYACNDITFEFASPYFVEEKKTVYSYCLEGYEDSWSLWNKENKAVFTNLWEGDYVFKVKARNIYGIESEPAAFAFTIQSPWYRTILAYFVYGVLSIFVIVIIVKLYTRKLKREKIQLEKIVMERTAEIRQQKDAIEEQNVVLHEQKEEILKQKEEITSSIIYAKRIQRAIVPSEELATCLLKDYFLLWRPRDIVSGDFWWLGEKNGLVIAAAADCTGHGVPGAFMSMLGVSFLNEIVNQRDNTLSHEILNQLRRKVKTTMGQTGKEGEAKDGMDIALLVIDFNNMTMQYSGAYNPLYRFRSGEVEVFKGDRNPIGIYIAEKDSFTQNLIDLQKGDTLYIFSDGYIDQFGGERGEKLTQKRFKEFLESIQHLSMPEQREALDKHIDKWRGDTEQIDDIIVLGIRI